MPSLKHYRDEIYAGTNTLSDDTILDERQINEWMRSLRTVLIRNLQTNDKKDIDEALYQIIPCLEMELVDRSMSDCCNLTVQVGCKILRSKLPLPKLLFVRGQYGETNSLIVNSPDIYMPQFVYGTKNTALYGGNGRFNKNAIYTFTEIDKNGKPYLYAISKNKEMNYGGKVLYVKGIFEDPEALADYIDCDGNCSFDDESEYPIAGWMWEPIRIEIIKKIQIMYGKADTANNASDDSEVQVSGVLSQKR